ncbi:MAG TPA: S1C family serine protease, partial [Acidimicrobiia bacterium]|nr:S1C family serine protease [Acidimicrobiia bacterium]
PGSEANAGTRLWRMGLVALAGAGAVAVVLLTVGAFDSSSGSHRSAGTVRTVMTSGGTAAAALGSVVAVKSAGTEGAGVSLGGSEVLTNAHLVAARADVQVVTRDGRARQARVVGTDPDTDLALLDVKDGGLAGMPIAAMPPDKGTRVVAIAVHAETGRRTDTGVVSSVDELTTDNNGVVLAGLLRTDLARGAGDGGGALLDSDGALVGILIAPPGSTKTGLAVPIDSARDVAAQLRVNGHAMHGWLGVAGTDASDRPQHGAPRSGVAVKDVVPQSPAGRSGIASGDVIVAVAGRNVAGISGLMAEVRERRPGDRVELTVWRHGKNRNKSVQLGDDAAWQGAGAGTGATGKTNNGT